MTPSDLVGLLMAVSIDLAIRHANSVLRDLDQQAFTDWRSYLMPGTLIPKVLGLAWIIILVEHFKLFSALQF